MDWCAGSSGRECRWGLLSIPLMVGAFDYVICVRDFTPGFPTCSFVAVSRWFLLRVRAPVALMLSCATGVSFFEDSGRSSLLCEKLYCAKMRETSSHPPRKISPTAGPSVLPPFFVL